MTRKPRLDHVSDSHYLTPRFVGVDAIVRQAKRKGALADYVTLLPFVRICRLRP